MVKKERKTITVRIDVDLVRILDSYNLKHSETINDALRHYLTDEGFLSE